MRRVKGKLQRTPLLSSNGEDVLDHWSPAKKFPIKVKLFHCQKFCRFLSKLSSEATGSLTNMLKKKKIEI